MFSITVYSRPFTVSHKAGDCRSARPSKTTHLCSLGCRHQHMQLCRDGVTVPRGPAGPSTWTPSPEPLPSGSEAWERQRPPLPYLLPCLSPGVSSSREFSPFLVQPWAAPGRSFALQVSVLAPSLPAASSKGLCQVPLLSLGGHLAHRLGSRWGLGAPLCFSQ